MSVPTYWQGHMLGEIIEFIAGALLIAAFVFFSPFITPEVRKRQPVGLGKFFSTRPRVVAYALMAKGVGVGLSFQMTWGTGLGYAVMAVCMTAWGFWMRQN